MWIHSARRLKTESEVNSNVLTKELAWLVQATAMTAALPQPAQQGRGAGEEVWEMEWSSPCHTGPCGLLQNFYFYSE